MIGICRFLQREELIAFSILVRRMEGHSFLASEVCGRRQPFSSLCMCKDAMSADQKNRKRKFLHIRIMDDVFSRLTDPGKRAGGLLRILL